VRGLVPVVRSAALAVAVAVAATALLAGCTASKPVERASASCVPAQDGAVSKSLQVSGGFGNAPKLAFRTPLPTVSKTQRSVVSAGTGAIVKTGARVNVDFALYDGSTGEEVTTTRFDGDTVPLMLDASSRLLPGFIRTIACSTVGSRVVGVIPPTDGFGTAGSTSLKIGAKDTIVMVADIVSVSAAPLASAQGETQPAIAGMPVVKLDAQGTPTVTVPKTAQPTGFLEETLIRGTGKRIGRDANVIVNYQLLSWRTGRVIGSFDTWKTAQVATFNLGHVVPGFTRAIEGKTVGSRVLFVVPPALGYGSKGDAKAGISGSDDLVFLVDVLGIG
jgi:peptidylprolyl isomerase